MKNKTEHIAETVKDVNEYVKTVKEPAEAKKREEQIEEFKEIIETERELLKTFSNDRLNLEVIYGKKLLKFRIKPLESSEDIESIGLDFRTHMDLSDLEKEIILKKYRGEKLSSNEQEVYDKKEVELAQDALGEILVQAPHILATFVSPPSFNRVKDLNKRYERKLSFWKSFPADLKMFLFSEVVNRLGVNPEMELKLFQVN